MLHSCMTSQDYAPCEHDPELPVSGYHLFEEIAWDFENDVAELEEVSHRLYSHSLVLQNLRKTILSPLQERKHLAGSPSSRKAALADEPEVTNCLGST